MINSIFIIPIIITFCGFLMNKYPPKKVNWFIGYRTIKSMQNEKVWEIANRYCGRLWIKIGLIMILIAFILSIIIYLKVIIISETFIAIIIICELVLVLLSGLIVEKHIKK